VVVHFIAGVLEDVASAVNERENTTWENMGAILGREQASLQQLTRKLIGQGRRCHRCPLPTRSHPQALHLVLPRFPPFCILCFHYVPLPNLSPTKVSLPVGYYF
jgi:hypothetical protein